jgi:hypothetical protein
VGTTREKLPFALRSCADAGCAAQALAPLGVEIVLVSFIVPGPQGGAVARVEVVDRSGIYPGMVDSPDSRSPVEDALDLALSRRARGPGPWLTVQGQPAGAEVLLNGRPIGTLPRYYGRIEPGVAQLSVRARGFRPYNQMLEIEAILYAHQLVEVRLEPAPEDLTMAQVEQQDTELITSLDDLPDEMPTEGSVWNYVLGGASVAAGLALWVKPALSLAKDGECHTESSSGCESVVRFGSAATLHAVVGSVLVLGGAAVLVFQPFQVAVSGDDDEAWLRIGGNL